MYTSVHQPVGILKINGIRAATAAFNSILAQIMNGFFTNQNDLIRKIIFDFEFNVSSVVMIHSNTRLESFYYVG